MIMFVLAWSLSSPDRLHFSFVLLCTFTFPYSLVSNALHLAPMLRVTQTTNRFPEPAALYAEV